MGRVSFKAFVYGITFIICMLSGYAESKEGGCRLIGVAQYSHRGGDPLLFWKARFLMGNQVEISYRSKEGREWKNNLFTLSSEKTEYFCKGIRDSYFKSLPPNIDPKAPRFAYHGPSFFLKFNVNGVVHSSSFYSPPDHSPREAVYQFEEIWKLVQSVLSTTLHGPLPSQVAKRFNKKCVDPKTSVRFAWCQ